MANKSATNPISITRTGTTVFLSAGNGVDEISADSLFTNAGYTGNSWAYEIAAGNGADIVWGSSRNEKIWGDSKGNTDTSGNGADQLHGGGGNDEIHGGNGDDFIWGDQGADFLYGDRGADTFKYNFVSDSNADGSHNWSSTTGDWIKDFNKSEGDKLDLRAIPLTGSGHPDMLTWGSGPGAYGVWIGSYTGGDKIVYADTDGDGLADVAIRVTGTVDSTSFLGINHGPTAAGESANVVEDHSISGTVTGNDSDPDGNTLTYSLTGGPIAGLTFGANGSYSFDAGNTAYQHLAAGATQNVLVNYQVSDGHGGTANATLTITITGVNDGPTSVAISDHHSDEDTALSFSVASAFHDADDGAVLTYSATLEGGGDPLPSWLHFNGSTGTFTGTPPADYNGSVSVTVTASDGSETTSQSFDVIIDPVNDAPASVAISDHHSDEDTALSFSVAGAFSDVDGDTLTYSATLQGGGSLPGWLSFDTSTGTFSGTPPADYNGSTAVTVTASDGSLTTSQNFAVVIDPVNDAPTSVAISDHHSNEDTALNFSVASSFSDVDGDTLTYSATLQGGGSLPGWLSFDTSTGTFSGTPPADYNGSTAVTVTASDGSLTTSQDFAVVVDPVNDAPAHTGAAPALADGTEDTAYAVSATDLLTGWTDVDGDTLSVAGLTANHGTVTDNGDGTYTITLDANYNGPVELSYNVTDGTAPQSASRTFNVAPVNDAPSSVAISDHHSNEDTALSFSVASAFSDVDGDILTYSATLQGGGSLPGWLSFDSSTGTFSGTPPANYNGSTAVTVTASDGSLTSSQNFAVVIDPVNDAPTSVAISDHHSNEDTALSFSVAGAFSDVDGDTLTYSATLQGGGSLPGWLSFDTSTGTFSGTPPADYNGSTAVTVTASDGSLTTSQDFAVVVDAVNDAAVIGGSDTGSVTEDAVTNTASGTLTISDVDSANTFVAQTNSGGTYGSFSIDAAGAWTYTLNNSDTDTNALNDGQHPTETFHVSSADGTIHDVVITVNGHTDVTYTTPPVFSGVDPDYDHDGDEAAHKVVPGPVVVTDDPGAHTLYGSDQGDMINAGTGNDNIYGYGGNDVIDGQGGQDVSIYGQAGNDTLSGGQGADKIYGGSGDDIIYGNNATDTPDDNQADTIYGGSGNDTIFGNNGADLIYGNYGADQLTGGAGADTFVYVSKLDTGDRITDFTHAQGDKIDLQALGVTTLGADTTNPGSLAAHSVGFHYNGADTILYVDTDGIAGADMEITLTGNITPVVSDFILHP